VIRREVRPLVDRIFARGVADPVDPASPEAVPPGQDVQEDSDRSPGRVAVASDAND
jgi:hypothetical protein